MNSYCGNTTQTNTHTTVTGGYIPRLDLAYETWGELNAARSNAILLCPILSASSHACSTKVSTTYITMNTLWRFHCVCRCVSLCCVNLAECGKCSSVCVVLIWLSVALCVLLQTNPSKGWWEEFIGPGRALDTNQYYVVCSNIIGGCYGSSGPSSTNPTTGAIYYIQYQSIHNSTKLDLLLKTYSMP